MHGIVDELKILFPGDTPSIMVSALSVLSLFFFT